MTTPCGGDYISVGRGEGGGGGSLDDHQYGGGGGGGIGGGVGGVRSGQSSPGDVRDGVSEIGAAEMRNCQQQTDISLKSNHVSHYSIAVSHSSCVESFFLQSVRLLAVPLAVDDVCGIAGRKCVTEGTIYAKGSSKKHSQIFIFEKIYNFELIFH